MLAKFDVTLMCDPDFPETKEQLKKIKGYTQFDRQTRFRSVTLTKEEAIKIFDRVEDYLETQLGAHLGKQS